MKAGMRQTRPVSIRRRPWIKWAMVLAVASTILLAIAEGGSSLVTIPNPSLVCLPLLAVVPSPFGRHGWMGERALTQYDEFEQVALLRATLMSHIILLGSVMMFLVWMAVGSGLGWPVPGTRQAWAALAMACFSIGISLPVMIAEWIIPLPPHSDDE